MKKYWFGMGGLSAAVLLIAVLFSRIGKTNLIISFGVVAADIVFWGVYIALAVVFVGGNALLLFRAMEQRKRERLAAAPQVPAISFTPQNGRLNPDQIRAEFKQYRGLRPALEDSIEHALSQMDSMDRKQAKIRQIFERNQVESMDEVETTVDDTEQAMCRNMVKVINRIILWDPLECNQPGKQDIYDGHRAYIQTYLARNDEILSMCDRLLSETVNYVDEKNAGVDNSTLHLEVMTETIQSLRKINGTEVTITGS